MSLLLINYVYFKYVDEHKHILSTQNLTAIIYILLK